jgi:hypothetical protein
MNGLDEAKALLTMLDRTGLGQDAEPIARATATDIAFRAAQLLALERIATVREEYAATNQAMIFEPEPDVVPTRDGPADEGDALRVIDIIDLLSDVDLPCVARHLHRGWQDRVQSCREARRITQKATGFALDENTRNDLLASLAVCNRVLRVPPPVTLVPGHAATWLPPVLRLIDRLAPAAEAEAFGALTCKLG